MRTTPKIPIELAWDEYVASMEGRLHGQTDAFKFAWKAAKKEWVGLTDEEISAFDTWHDNREEEVGWCNPSEIVAYIEAKLKEKNT
jgi:hypothetical protein